MRLYASSQPERQIHISLYNRYTVCLFIITLAIILYQFKFNFIVTYIGHYVYHYYEYLWYREFLGDNEQPNHGRDYGLQGSCGEASWSLSYPYGRPRRWEKHTYYLNVYFLFFPKCIRCNLVSWKNWHFFNNNFTLVVFEYYFDIFLLVVIEFYILH